MAESGGPGAVSRISGTPALKRVARSGERKKRGQQRRGAADEKPEPGEQQRPRKGRYLDEHC